MAAREANLRAAVGSSCDADNSRERITGCLSTECLRLKKSSLLGLAEARTVTTNSKSIIFAVNVLCSPAFGSNG